MTRIFLRKKEKTNYDLYAIIFFVVVTSLYFRSVNAVNEKQVLKQHDKRSIIKNCKTKQMSTNVIMRINHLIYKWEFKMEPNDTEWQLKCICLYKHELFFINNKKIIISSAGSLANLV